MALAALRSFLDCRQLSVGTMLFPESVAKSFPLEVVADCC